MEHLHRDFSFQRGNIYIYYTNSFNKIYTKELKKIGLEKVLCFFVLGTRLDIGKKVAEFYQPCSFMHAGETFKFLFFVANGFIDNVTKINIFYKYTGKTDAATDTFIFVANSLSAVTVT